MPPLRRAGGERNYPMLDRDKAISRSAPFALATLAIAGRSASRSLLWPWIGLENTDLVFLTAIVGVAVRLGLWPSLFASVVASLCYNFFFTAPYYTFTIDEPKNVIAVVFFTIVAIIVSNVAARARIEADAATARLRTTELLYAFSRKLAGVGTLDDVLWATAYQTALDAERAGRAAFARERRDLGEGGLPAGGSSGGVRPGGRRVGVEAQRACGTRRRRPAGRQAAVPADADRTRRHRRPRNRQ